MRRIIPPMKNKKGFTLVEILLVFALIAIIGTAAISNAISSSQTFSFLNNYKETMNSIRVARSYAITNVFTPPEGVVDPVLDSTRYGVMVESSKLSVFADVGETPYKLDTSASGVKDVFLDLLTVDLGAKYTLSVDSPLTLPLYFYFEPGTGELSAYDSGGLLNKRCISMEFSDGANLTKYIVIFAISGLPEAFDKNQSC